MYCFFSPLSNWMSVYGNYLPCIHNISSLIFTTREVITQFRPIYVHLPALCRRSCVKTKTSRRKKWQYKCMSKNKTIWKQKQNKENLNEVKNVNDVRVNDDRQDLNDWKTVAMVLDKFLFYLFFFLTTAANIIVLVVIIDLRG